MFTKNHFFLLLAVFLIVSCKKDDNAPVGQEPTLVQWYIDGDKDGFGNPDSALGKMAVAKPDGFVADNTDCNDSNENAFPGAIEDDYDGVDSNCDGLTETIVSTFSKTIGQPDSYESSSFLFELEDGNFVSGGYKILDTSNNYKDIWLTKVDAEGNVLWEKSFGGSNDEHALGMVKTSDGGIVISGRSASNDGDVAINFGYNDWWLLKIDSDGEIIWKKTLGGSGEDKAYDVIETNDGGYVVVGSSESQDGELPAVNEQDAYLVKIDASGNILWKSRYNKEELGDENRQAITSIIELSDGSFVATGFARETVVSPANGRIHKFDANGEVLWSKKIESDQSQYLYGIIKMGESDFLLRGKTGVYLESEDGWLLNINEDGDINWSKEIGKENDNEVILDMVTTLDGGALLAGRLSTKRNANGYNASDAWLVKLSASGDVEWENTYGGNLGDVASGIIDLKDEGIIISGETNSKDGDIPRDIIPTLATDMWIFKLKPNGKF